MDAYRLVVHFMYILESHLVGRTELFHIADIVIVLPLSTIITNKCILSLIVYLIRL